ncbi:conjugal transfer protein TraH (plasmid) [Xanthomonas sontii]|uniref:conjugal transfer protein TraH n=1 Tax=Xanthomonas sontii TaxID=2650745 RepID=UPI003F851A4F
MKQLLAKTIFVLVLVLGIGLFSGTARASSGFDKSVGDMFGAMSNVTDAQVFMTAKRGVISGGGIEVRNRMMNVNLVNFQPPSLSVGCNGISAFFGSFSFISKDQLLQAMRSIATAAVMYAFKIALAAMCPTCEEKLAALQDKMDKWNMNNINACQIGEKLISDTKLGAAIEEKSKEFGVATGMRKEYEDASARGESKAPSANATGRMTDAQRAEVFKGNQAWRMMKEKGLSKWGVNVSKELMEDVMSYTGTIVACVPNVDSGCATRATAKGASEAVSVRYIPYTMTLTELVKGNQGTKAVTRITCNDTNSCLNPVTKEVADFPGIEKQIMNVFVGETGLGGIVAEVAVPGATEPTAAEAGWITNTGSYGQIVLSLAKTNPEAARGFVNTFSEEMAVTVVTNVMGSYLQSVLIALGQEEGSDTTEFRNMATASVQRLREESVPYFNKARGRTEHVDYYLRMRDVSSPRTNISMVPAK